MLDGGDTVHKQYGLRGNPVQYRHNDKRPHGFIDFTEFYDRVW